VASRLPDGPAGSAAPGPPLDGSAPRPGPYRGAHRAPRKVGRRAVVVLIVGAAATLLLVRPWAASGPDAPDSALAGIAPDVSGWLADELPADTPVAASADVRAALAAAGADDRVGGPADDALRVVEGEPADDALVLARFESAEGTALSVVDPDPGGPTAAELERRRSLGAAVLANPVAGATGRAADTLRSGHVDARLLGLLAGLVSRMDVHVADLPPAPGEPADGPPARRLLVDEAGGERLTPGAAATDELITFLEAQRPPFAPDIVEPTDDGLLVGFDYVSEPDAAVTAANP
jgi:hypothetical protein